jgi:hypothetical protein
VLAITQPILWFGFKSLRWREGACAVPKPEYFRQLAERMLAVAMKTDDLKLAELLTTRAGEYLDEAMALEATNPPIVETPQDVAEQAEQQLRDDPEKQR